MDDKLSQRPPYLLAALAALGVLVLYLATLAPTTQFWDTSEYVTAAAALGIPHPPGNPLFTLIAHVWGLVPWAVDYARRINLLAAVTSAGSAGLWFLIGERWLRPIVSATWPRRLAAFAGVLVGATAFTVWNQSVVNEKVYTISLLSVALTLWLVIRWVDQPAATRRDHSLLLIIYLLALTATNHLMGLLVVPALLVYVLRHDARALLRPRLLLGATIVAALGVSVILFLAIRAKLFPVLNEGEPTTWAALREVLNRTQYGKPSLFENPMYASGEMNPGRSLVLVGQQLLNYVQYFTWQFGHDWSEPVRRGLAVLFAASGLLGARRQWRSDRTAALAMTVLMVTISGMLVFYLNFKWGFSQPWQGLEHEVRERDYFFLVSFSAFGVWVGLGLATVMEWIRDALPQNVPPRRTWALTTPVLLFALVPLAGNRLTAPRAGETMARDYARDLLQSVDPYAIIVTAGDNDTFPLWFVRDVEGVRRDVTVLVTSLANTNWYLRQLQRRPPGPFDPAAAPAVDRRRSWPAPTTPWMSRLYLGGPDDTLPGAIALDRPVSGMLGPIQVTIDPRQLGGAYRPCSNCLTRADLAVLQIIKDQLGRRPIYFSTSTAYYADQLGLTPYLVTEGLVRRLRAESVRPGAGLVAVPGLGLVDLPRTRTLAFEVYQGGRTAAQPRPRGWVDVPSQSALIPYAMIYDTLARALQATDPQTAARAQTLGEAIVANLSLPPAPTSGTQ